MTVSTSNIWKSAASAVRQPVRAREKNLHIGSTLHDLYRQAQTPNGEQTFDDLLDQLDAAEKAVDSRSRK